MEKSIEKIVLALIGGGGSGSVIIALSYGIIPAVIFLIAVAIVLA